MEQTYFLWSNKFNRWTNLSFYSGIKICNYGAPIPLSLENVTIILDYFNSNAPFKFDQWIIKIYPESKDVNVNQIINDHTCPSCKNDRCSRSEKSCWKCGEKL